MRKREREEIPLQELCVFMCVCVRDQHTNSCFNIKTQKQRKKEWTVKNRRANEKKNNVNV